MCTLVIFTLPHYLPLFALPLIPFLFPNSPLSTFFVYLKSTFYKRKHIIFVWVWLFLLNMISSSVHFPANDIILSFFRTENKTIMYIHHIFFIHFSIDGHLSWFHDLAVMNYATINMGMQKSLSHADFDSFGYISKSV
jgi:hypothetical protein